MSARGYALGTALLSLLLLAEFPRAECTGRGAAGADRPDPSNASYRVEGREIRLVDGVAETEAALGSAAKLRTAVFGAPAFGDLNGDGREDAAVLLVRETGGSGTFYYAAATLGGDGEGAGTNAVLLGDRVAPQDVVIRGRTVVVDYADRKPGEPMAAPPTQAKSLVLEVRDGDLVPLPAEAEPGADLPSRIAGTEWRLVRLVVEGKEWPVASDAVPTLSVDTTGKVQGLATLNRYFGQAEFDREGRLRWSGPFGSTMMAGPEPLMDQEQTFLSALGQVRQAALENGRLLLQDGAGLTVLEFQR